jgi:HPt (histidine-containing phosphotransfer) domain-containing protein
VAGEPDPVEEVVGAFLKVTPGRLSELLRAATADNRDDVRELAHALKGSAGMVGATALQTAAGEVEQFARDSAARTRAPAAAGEPSGRARCSQGLVVGAEQLGEIFARTKPVLESLVRGGL